MDDSPATPEENALAYPEATPPQVPSAADAAAPAPAPASGGGGRRGWIKWLAIALGVVVVIALVLPIYSTLQPDYYRRYPSLAGRIDAWSRSTHSKIACSGCHVDPGVGGFLAFASKAIPDFYSQLVFGPNATNVFSTPHTAACQKCHTNYRTISPNGDLLIPHKAHVVVLGIACPVCHKNLVHSLNSQGFNAPEMQTCLKCHDGKTASNKCSACHTRKEVPASHKAADWLQIHYKETKSIDCAQCHGWTPDYCKQCHSQKPPSHTATWKTDHRVEAAKNPKMCLVCHEESFCKRCH